MRVQCVHPSSSRKTVIFTMANRRIDARPAADNVFVHAEDCVIPEEQRTLVQRLLREKIS
jgi:hypothetical protein